MADDKEGERQLELDSALREAPHKYIDRRADKKDLVEVDDSMMTPFGPPNPFAHVLKIPNECVGVLIGKGGESIAKL